MAEDSLQSLDKQTERLFARMRENQEKSENAHKESGKLTEEKHQADAAFLLAERDEEHLGRESIRLDEEIKKKNEEGKGALVRLSDLQNSKKAMACLYLRRSFSSFCMKRLMSWLSRKIKMLFGLGNKKS